ncbi:DegT/DnrJ/EryC1/StrS family aminotransferase [Acetatifactor muris]|uniref:UDP-2-acetamido-2-deoxy-3-oxo-D-glucuronate aminotransferase n=1 Tax=Acetatifactor muris TaxID=879566 RepID=A0A2K4ZK47_9FIRM|nr:DegT/DnrJ/EryC1/StrS family aminotransferase [Acetatifactor muris]MCR2049081.1 DegT/DnrJ/EryC1/StrS family aminotransferase [Acetatifactor muris]SOY30776.1 UDP-2-acetamido-2-deoxy-3-oxo-D-glucuronate aminotransferase [Acetatifactor muris]
MQFRDLQKQYQILKPQMAPAIQQVLTTGNFISGSQVTELEEQLSAYVGTKHCITCGNGTDALTLALMVWNIGPGDAVFVPDFTFFASGETPAYEGAVPIFVDVEEDTFNMSPSSLEEAILQVKGEGKLTPRVIVAVDLFGQPADYPEIRQIAEKYNLFILEDGAQGFGGRIGARRACSFGDISTTSFFPAKPLGCYGDGGAIFTDNDEWAALLRSYRIHGKGADKYDNVRIGMNSRLDTLQAAVLQVKLKAFDEYELTDVNKVAHRYTEGLREVVKAPIVREGFYSSWAQYSILLKDKEERDRLQAYLKEKGIPTMVYYPRPMSMQGAFAGLDCVKVELPVTADLCRRVLALPMHPYLTAEEQEEVIREIKAYVH